MTAIDSRMIRRLTIFICIVFASLSFVQGAATAPLAPAATVTSSDQTPDWLSPESAARLAVGIPVLVPSYVPGPFGGEPDISAYDGYYSLYWMIPGAPPTYLRITGEYGGAIPDYSAYDRNVQLVQNDSVQGYPAWHDLTPIYDLVYWQIGDVTYSVDSHNLSGDDTMSIANSLYELSIPESGGGETDTPPDSETPAPDLTIGVPDSVGSGEVVSVGIDGTGSGTLITDGGYFVDTQDTYVNVQDSGAVDWQAPNVDEDRSVSLTLYDVNDNVLDSRAVTVQGGLSVGETSSATLNCTSSITMGHTGRILLTGTGTVVLSTDDGSFPAESPNTDFQSDADGGSSIYGQVDGSGVDISLLTPDYETTVTVTAIDPDGNWLDECSIEVVSQQVDGDLQPEDASPELLAGSAVSGDQTGVPGNYQSRVSRVMANRIGFAGDGSGGPEANATDYDEQARDAAMQAAIEEAKNRELAAANGETSDDSAVQDALGPTMSANGLVAQVMSHEGGTIGCPPGATIIVPTGALSDPTTVAIQPVNDQEISAPAGIELVPGTAYDMTAASSDGRSVDSFAEPFSLTITLPQGDLPSGSRIYRIDGSGWKEVETIDASRTAITAESKTYARFVVGTPTTAAVAGGLSIGKIGLAALLVAIGSLLLTFLFRLLSGRQHQMVGRKLSPSRARYR